MMSGPTLFFADSHLDPTDLEGIEAFGRFADAAAALGPAAVYCLGDLFHFWVGPRQADLPGIRPVIEAMARLGKVRDVSGALAPVYFMAGNRDFHLDRGFLASLGWTLIEEGHRIRLGERTVVMVHGDLLCTRDYTYRFLRAVLRSPPVLGLVRALPLGCSLRLAGGLRGVSSRKVKRIGEGAGMDPAAVKKILEGGDGKGAADVLIAGHLHQARRESYELEAGARGGEGSRQGELFVLPGWEEGPAWLVWRPESGGFEFGTGMPG